MGYKMKKCFYFILITTLAFISQPVFSNFHKYDLAGQKSAINDQPKEAMSYYSKSFEAAGNNISLQRKSLFNIGRMELWLEDYPKAEKTYCSLIKISKDKTDHEIALAGLVKSTAYQDKPRSAFSLIPKDFHYTTLKAVLAASQAALWSGWAEKAKHILNTNPKIISESAKNPNSPDAKDLKEVIYGTNAETAKYSITPSSSYEHDTDGVTIMHYGVDAACYVKPNMHIGLNPNLITLSKDGQRITGKSFLIKMNHNPNDVLSYQLALGDSKYDVWNQVLWSARINYQPNDIVNLSLDNHQEVVETIDAINNKVSYNQTQFKAKFSPFYRLKISGTVFYGMFSDHNNRTGYFTSVDYLLFNKLGLGLGAQARGYSNSKTGTIGYFNPSNFNEQDLLFKLSRKLTTNWRYYLNLCLLGQQHVSGGDDTNPKFIEVGLRGFITKNLLLDLFYNYSNPASFMSASGYGRHYGAASLQILF